MADRIAETDQHQPFESRSCGVCGKERPLAQPWFGIPKGWDYVLVKSGPKPVYQWRCEECRQSTR